MRIPSQNLFRFHCRILIVVQTLFACSGYIIWGLNPFLSVGSRIRRTHNAPSQRIHNRHPTSERGLAADAKRATYPDPFLTPALIEALDLVPLLQRIAAYAGTRRGRQAILAVVEAYQEADPQPRVAPRTASSSNRKEWLSQDVSFNSKPQSLPQFQMHVATSRDETISDYRSLEQAMLGLQGMNNATFPPLYASDSGPLDKSWMEGSDDDEWLSHRSVADFELQDILKAEQVVKKLLGVAAWAHSEPTRQWMPQLANVGCQMDRESLSSLFGSLQDTVEIVRVRSVTDVNARFTFVFRLRGSSFPALSMLRNKEETLLRQLSNKNSHLSKELKALQDSIAVQEQEIKDSLAYSILAFVETIDEALNSMSQLDMIFAKAAFAVQSSGRIPVIKAEGCIDVQKFVHPLLSDSTAAPVPVDLILSCRKTDRRALIISGSNGGGKTLCLKSFGLVVAMTRLGVAIPSQASSVTLRVDFFDEVLASIGDRQNLLRGASTYAAQLETYSNFIQRVSNTASENSLLVLLDELGGGTESNAGGAIAQAILEKLTENRSCAAVATTHSSIIKTLSFSSNDFDCASVLIADDESMPKPTYQLQYGIIGQSHALSAASRCTPPLPKDVLDRASELLSLSFKPGYSPERSPDEGGLGDTSVDFLQAMSKSLSMQLKMAESKGRAITLCQRAILSLAKAYERHLEQLEARVNQCYESLKADDSGSLEVLGATLSELRIIKKVVQSDTDLLAQRGLKLVPFDYPLREGESVVIVCEGEWEGVMATVASCGNETEPNRIYVIPSFDPRSALTSVEKPSSDSQPIQSLPFYRYQLAMWDYDSVWAASNEEEGSRVTSISEAKRRMSSILSLLETVDEEPRGCATGSNDNAGAHSQSPKITSSRQRKALAKLKPKIKRKKR